MKYKQWNQVPSVTGAARAMEAQGVHPLVASVLCARGLVTLEKAKQFLASDDTLLCPPDLMKDMDKAVERIKRALTEKEAVAVYGDYDVDGITAACLLTQFLRDEGGTVIPYIPDRLEEGYGLNREAVDVLRAQGVSLIITVDCGITAVEEAAYAMCLGVDVVITDHHECKNAIPDALAVVDPRRSDCPYPFKSLAGVGVALKLVLAIGGKSRQEELMDRYVDLAAIGTVADVMCLLGENRAIVRKGLKVLKNTSRPGIKALFHEAGMDTKPVTASTIGYMLAPRINAAGRMCCATLAAELLLTKDAAKGVELAKALCDLNRERQAIEGKIFDSCVEILEREPARRRYAIVLADENWHQGVVGIVASRLTEKYACPTFMICLQNGLGKGSCRSCVGFNLFSALERCQHLLEGFGGHALAAGFTIREENIPAFARCMSNQVAEHAGGDVLISTLEVDAEVENPALLDAAGVEALSALEPYGAGNPKPVFTLSGATVCSITDVGGGRHLKLKVSRDEKTFDAIFFSTNAAACGLKVGDRADVAFYPQFNEFRGMRTIQLQVVDIRPARTRAQCEKALYDKMNAGEDITPKEAAALLPSRTEFANLWRYLKVHAAAGPIEGTGCRLAKCVARECGGRPVLMRTLVCLDVLNERGLILLEMTADHLRITLTEHMERVDLDRSPLMCKLRAIMES